jgi:hypothetical protein
MTDVLPAILRHSRTAIANNQVRAMLLMLAGLICSALLAAPTQARQARDGTTITESFRIAARHWAVPVEILMGVGYVESHWEQRGGEPSLDRGYGIMHLVEGPGGTLERSAELTGLSEDAIRTTAFANIEAGAALLSDISRKLSLQTASGGNDLASWFSVVAQYSEASDASVKDGYAREVYRAISEGRTATLQGSGEVVTLPATSVGKLPPASVVVPDSDDYAAALWVAAHANNYSVGRQYGPLSFIVIHDTEGSYSSAISWFQNSNSGVSSHYVIRSSDGQITQMVRDANTAYHAGNWDYNVRALGIEHEGFMNQQGWYTEAMYQSSSALARHLADRWGIRKDRAHVIGHYQVPGSDHTDPGPYWNWPYYMSMVRQDANRAALVDNTDPGFAAVPPQIDAAHHWYVYGGGYNNTNTYVTGSVTNQTSSVNSGTWTAYLSAAGYYDVYAFVPWVDNNTPDTSSAKYKVRNGASTTTVAVSQRAITDVGNGSWAHLGKFFFSGGNAVVSLNDYTGETGRNVWFDALMWIPSVAGAPAPTDTPAPPPTSTRVPTRTATPAPTWTPGPCGMRFSDLPDTHWAYTYVSYLFCNGVISGYADGTFRPGEGTTRAQLSKMVALGFGWTLYYPLTPDFSDVPPENPFYQYIETAYIRGVVTGYLDGTFRPGNPVTRSQVTKMLILAKGWAPSYPPFPSFADVPADNWAYGYIEASYSRGIVTGYSDGTFRPGLPVNRTQFSKMLTLTLQEPADVER